AAPACPAIAPSRRRKSDHDGSRAKPEPVTCNGQSGSDQPSTGPHRGPAKPGRRTTWERLSRMDDLIRAGRYPNSRSLALKLGVSVRTIKRDLDYLRRQRHL